MTNRSKKGQTQEMNSELDAKLVEEFPLLYKERHMNMQQTCMCWGFSCRDGWYDLIYDLSSKLEPLIQQYLDDHPFAKCECGCAREAHIFQMNGPCITVSRISYRATQLYGYTVPELWKDLTVRYPKNKRYALKHWWRNFRHMIKYKVGSLINKLILRPLFRLHIAVKKVPCKCEEYYPNHSRAVQVKEKFGTLSFYMSSGTNEIWNLIRQAENTSAITCEDCGEPGVLRASNWVKTLCDKCAKKCGKEETHEEWVKEREAANTKMHTMISIVPQKQANG